MKEIRPILLALLLLLTGCRSTLTLEEYHLDYTQPSTEITFEELPERARLFHKVCHTPGDIKEVYSCRLENNSKPAYVITFNDGGEMIFDKNGKCIEMTNLAHGLPTCWTDQIPVYKAIYMAISVEMAKTTSKPWDVRMLDIQPKGYLVKVGEGVDISIFIFDKNGRLKDIFIEI